MPWHQTPLAKEESRRVYKCDDERLSGSTKCWIFKIMLNIWSLRNIIFNIRPRVLHSGLLLWQHFHAPKRDTELNEQWLVVWHVGETASWAGLGQQKLPWIPDLQPSVWRSGYTSLEDRCSRSFISYFIILSFTASRYCTVDLRQQCREMALICFESMHNSLCHSSDAFLYFLSVKKVQINSWKCLSKYAIPSLSFLLHDTMYTNQHTK